MFVIRLPNGNLMVPQTATGNDGRILGDVYVEIGPQDADYARLAEQALTSDSRNLRCPPGVRMLVMRPEAAQRVTVFGSTRKSAATSPGVSKRSLLPSTSSFLRPSPSSLG
jgi:hypothetical protein